MQQLGVLLQRNISQATLGRMEENSKLQNTIKKYLTSKSLELIRSVMTRSTIIVYSLITAIDHARLNRDLCDP